MKFLIKALIFTTIISTPFLGYSQSVFVVRYFDNNINKEAKTCPIDANALAKASQEMFEGKNPNYFIVDLIKDGYIGLNDSFEYRINIKLSDPPFKDAKYALNLPEKVQIQYIKKFEQFLEATGMTKKRFEDYNTGSISFYNIISQEDIINPKSEFRTQLTILALKNLGYYYYKDEGRLRIYQELVKDNLAPLDKALNLEFSKKGFFVHGKRLTSNQRRKYSDICKKYFGNDYYTDKSSWKVGALPEKTLEKDIAELKKKLVEQSIK